MNENTDYETNHKLLDELGVWEPFSRNFRADPLNKGLSVETYLQQTPTPVLIDQAFTWAKTPEGYDFWERESVRLQRYI